MLIQRDQSSRCTFVIVSAVAAITLAVACAVGAIALVLLSNGNGDDGRADIPTAANRPGLVGEVLVTVFDVGQGQAVAVITPDGRAALIDSGRSRTRIEEHVVPYLRAKGIDELELLILSHPDQDHVGGMPRILDLMPVGLWVDPAIPTTNQTYAATLEAVLDAEIPAVLARRGERFDLGAGVILELLWPVDPLLISGGEPDSNENSAVVRITHGDIVVLDPGDLERRGEAALVELDGANLVADVLIAGHHGSNSSSTAAFLDAVDCDVAIISAGRDNPYGHPHAEVLQRLRFRGVEIYRTDLDGAIEIRSDGSSYAVTTLGVEAAR